MKEVRFFYAPEAESTLQLPEEEAQHCLRVLRLQVGDEIMLMDGNGHYFRAEITSTTGKKCFYQILESENHPKEWGGWLHLAVAPTKNMDRIEWLAEKATEVGFDELSFLQCQFSERKVVKNERIDKILVSGMKQSHKSYKPQLNELTDFKKFIDRVSAYEQKYIAHCYEEQDIEPVQMKSFLYDALEPGKQTVVLIGPEGDFSIEEVKYALEHGFQPISLGKSRLRTETAALMAVHMMQMKNMSHS